MYSNERRHYILVRLRQIVKLIHEIQSIQPVAMHNDYWRMLKEVCEEVHQGVEELKVITSIAEGFYFRETKEETNQDSSSLQGGLPWDEPQDTSSID